MQQVPVLRGSADPQQTKLERWSSLAIAPLLGRLQRAGEIAPDANPNPNPNPNQMLTLSPSP